MLFTHMWDIKLKATNEQKRKTKIHRHKHHYGGDQKEGMWEVSKDKRAQCEVTEEDLSLGGNT